MLTINIPDDLQKKLSSLAVLANQTPEEVALEIIEERIDHQSAYHETAYLAKSETNDKSWLSLYCLQNLKVL